MLIYILLFNQLRILLPKKAGNQTKYIKQSIKANHTNTGPRNQPTN